MFQASKEMSAYSLAYSNHIQQQNRLYGKVLIAAVNNQGGEGRAVNINYIPKEPQTMNLLD